MAFGAGTGVAFHRPSFYQNPLQLAYNHHFSPYANYLPMHAGNDPFIGYLDSTPAPHIEVAPPPQTAPRQVLK